MQIYLPIAEMAVPGEIILMLGAFVGFLSGVFGVGGGFLATPFMIFLGIPPAIAVATQANQLVAASISGVLGHLKKGNVDVQMGMVMMGGGMVGTIIGIFIFKLLQMLGQIDLAISLLYIVLLSTIGSMMLYESTMALLNKSKKKDGDVTGWWAHPFYQNLPYKMQFKRSKLYMSALLPGAVGLIGGLLVSIMGIGGGFILVPAMIYVLGMPTLLVAGTSLFQIIFTTAFATFMHAVANNTVDMVLALLLIVGGVVGAQLGVFSAKYIRGTPARLSLALMVVLVAIKLAADMVVPPGSLYETVVQ